MNWLQCVQTTTSRNIPLKGYLWKQSGSWKNMGWMKPFVWVCKKQQQAKCWWYYLAEGENNQGGRDFLDEWTGVMKWCLTQEQQGWSWGQGEFTRIARWEDSSHGGDVGGRVWAVGEWGGSVLSLLQLSEWSRKQSLLVGGDMGEKVLGVRGERR